MEEVRRSPQSLPMVTERIARPNRHLKGALAREVSRSEAERRSPA